MNGVTPAQPLRAVVLSDQVTIRNTARQSLLRQGPLCSPESATSLAQAAQTLTEPAPDLLVVALSPSPERALATLAEVRSQTRARVLAVGPTSDAKLILRALRAGADEYLDEEDLDAELSGAVTRLRSGRATPLLSGKVIALLGASGGSGCSTLAVNFATALAREYRSALLVDLALQGGDLSALLDLKPAHTLADLCHSGNRLDRAMVEDALVAHPCGVKLLAAPRSRDDAALVTAAGIRAILEMTRRLSPYLILDLEVSFEDEQVQALRTADEILLVFRLDFTCLRNASRSLESLERLGISAERVRLVVNRYGRAGEVPYGRAEEALRRKIFHYVPDDTKTINRANNNGVPAMLEAPKAKVCLSIAKLAMSLATSSASPAQ